MFITPTLLTLIVSKVLKSRQIVSLDNSNTMRYILTLEQRNLIMKMPEQASRQCRCDPESFENITINGKQAIKFEFNPIKVKITKE